MNEIDPNLYLQSQGSILPSWIFFLPSTSRFPRFKFVSSNALHLHLLNCSITLEFEIYYKSNNKIRLIPTCENSVIRFPFYTFDTRISSSMNTIILNFIHGILFRTHFTKWNTSGRGSVRSLLTGSDVCYNARRNLVDGSGWITGMQRDWPTARNNRIRDNCESFPERRMAVSPAKISRKTILIPLRVIVAPLSRGISLQFAIYEISICGKGGAAGVV